MSEENREKELVEKHTEFMLHLGMCISRWSNIDGWLFQIYRDCIGGSSWRAANLFYRSPNISDHMNLVNIIIDDIVFENKAQNSCLDIEWRQASKLIKELLEVRNAIAHNPVIFQGHENDLYWHIDLYQSGKFPYSKDQLEGIRFRVVTDRYKMQRRRREKDGRFPIKRVDVIELDDLKQHIEDTSKVDYLLVGIAVEATKISKGQPLKYPPQEQATL
jgi:hypothetical protein